MKEWNKAVVLISGIVAHICAAAEIIYLFRRPGALSLAGGFVSAVALLVSGWWLIHSLEE